MIENIEFFAGLAAFVGFFVALLWLGRRRDAARTRATRAGLPRGTIEPLAAVPPPTASPGSPLAGLRVRVESLDVGDGELESQLPLDCTWVRRLPGDDRDDYDLFRLDVPVTWRGRTVRTVVIAPRNVGARLGAGMRSFPVGLALVVDDAIETAARLDFAHARYVAVALVSSIA